MIEFIEFDDGYGIFQNKSKFRLFRESFKDLLLFLRLRFKNYFVQGLYGGEQDGYLFMASKKDLERATNSFFETL